MSTKSRSTQEGSTPVGLTTQQMRHLPKPRDGFVQLVEPLATLCEANASKLGTTAMSPAAMRAQASDYQQKLQNELALERQLKTAKEERLQSAATLWSAMLALYALAQAAARSDRDIRAAVSQLTAFFKNGHKAATTPVATPA